MKFTKAYRASLQKLAAVTKNVRLLGMLQCTLFNHGLIDIRRGKSGCTIQPVGSKKTFGKIIFLKIDIRFVSDDRLRRGFQFAADQNNPESVLRQPQCMGHCICHKNGGLLRQKRNHILGSCPGIQIDEVVRLHKGGRICRYPDLFLFIQLFSKSHLLFPDVDSGFCLYCSAKHLDESAFLVKYRQISADRGL